MTPFKAGDRVRTIRLHEGANKVNLIGRRSVGTILHVWDSNAKVQFDNGKTAAIPFTNLVPHKPRKAPTKTTEKQLRQEIAIRNDAIDRLENDLRILQSEKVRLGEQLAYQKETAEHRFEQMMQKRNGLEDTITHLTEQNDALRKELVAANQAHEIQHNKTLQYQRLYETYQSESNRISHEQASNALRLYIYKTAFAIAAVVAAVLGGIMIWG